MVSQSQRKMEIRKNFNDLRSLTSPKSVQVRRISAIIDALSELLLKLKALNKEYNNLMKKQFQIATEVEVDRMEGSFLVRISCQRSQDLLVTILEAFEEMGVNILQAKVSCNKSFWMEVLAEDEGQRLDVEAVKLAILKALKKKIGEPLVP